MLLRQGILGVLLPFMAAGLSMPPLPFMGKPGPAGCGMFEEFRGCGTPCPPTCDTLKETVCCEVICMAGCFCADGFILEKDPTTGPRKCIPLNQCPSPGVLSFESPTFRFLEGSGKAIITVVRVNGSYSPISVRYRVVDPVGSYDGLVGELHFPDGVVSRTIEIPLQDNAVRNPDLTVRLELFEPSRKTGIVTGTSILTILDDDMTPGYLELEKNHLSVPENGGSVSVQILRHEGSDGQLRVKYRTVPVSASSNMDFSPATGELVFEEGETSKTVTVSIVDDEVRETPEKFRIELFDFTHGPGVLNFRRRGSVLAADVTIVDNDMRPGILQVEQPSYTVFENAITLDVSVVRLDGQDGQVKVKYETRPKSAKAGQDFETKIGELIFEEGELRKMIRIKIVDDNVREPEESFEVLLFDATPGPGTINFRGLEETRRRTTITIIDDDMRPGSFMLENRSYEVPETVGTFKIGVVRVGGSDGQIRVKYRTVPKNAQVNQDFVVSEGELVFEEGQTRKDIVVQIVNDDIREPTEGFEVQLLDPTAGLGVLNFRRFTSNPTAMVSIIDDDMKPGILRLEKTSYEVYEGVGTVTIAVVRLDGTDGEIRVKYRTIAKTAQVNKDFVYSEDELVFGEGVNRKDITIQILNNNIREPTKIFEVQLLDATPGLGVINFRRFTSNPTAVIAVLDDDMRPGTFQLEKPSYDFFESVGTITIGVIRLDGKDGEMRVKYKTIPKTAQVHQDFIPVEGELVFAEQETRKEIVIKIIDDDVREATKTFEVQLWDITPGVGVINFRRLLATPTAIVSIRDDDMRPGTFQLERPSYDISENAGTITIGVIRLDGTDGEMRVKYKTIPKTAQMQQDFIPIEGELVFGEQENRKEIVIKIVDDDVREATKTFEVQLWDITPGEGVINFRRFTSNPSTIISINDDDMRPGTFQLERNSYEINENAGTITIGVIRLDGTDGEMRVKYKTIPKTAQVQQDFIPDEGELVFGEKETRKEIVIKIIDDDVREGTKTFEVQLLDITPGVGVINFRRFTSNPTAIVSINDDDMRPGILQLESHSYEVLENAGTLKVVVVRLDGSDGEIRVKYRTVASSALVNQDFVHEDGELVFAEGENRKDITIQIIDDDVREPTKTFEVQLLDPRAGPGVINFKELGQIRSAVVTIKDNDMKPGELQIEEAVYQFFENVGTVQIPVVRVGGSDGQIHVFYRTAPKTALTGSDFTFSSGELVFKEGETRKIIEIHIKNDDVKEEIKSFEVELLNPEATVDVVNFRGFLRIPKAEVFILDDDMSPGFFEIDQSSYVVPENAGQVQISVIRLGGTDGQVKVKFRTVARSAAAQTDFLPVEGELVFEEGEDRKFIVVQILNDNAKEHAETFEVQLFDPQAGKGVINFRGTGSKSMTVVTIKDDDITPGILELDRPTHFVNENVGVIQVVVIRRGGTDGQIRCRYQSRSKSATAETDFAPVEGELVFENGDTSKIINVQILDDRVREPRESFEIVLMEPNQGLERTLGQTQTTEVVISDDDMTPGFLELEETSYVVSESVGTLTVVVRRVDGSDGQIQVGYVTSPQTALPGFDFTPIKGELVFEDGETRKTIQIQIRDDNQKEPTENFEIQLVDPGTGLNFRNLGQKQKALVTINDDDGKLGFFEFEQASYSILENAGSLKVRVTRLGGSDGQVKIRFKTVPKTAEPTTDFQELSGELVFEDGETTKNIFVPILNDGVREPTETFEIQLLDAPSPQGFFNLRVLGQKTTTVVTIFDDDGNPGFLELEEPTYVVSEGIHTLQLVVNRRGGRDGRIQCRYQTTARSALAGVDFEPRSGELIFEDGEIKKIIDIQIVNDGIKESIKNFEVQLLDPVPVPGIFNFSVVGTRRRTVVTIADDDTKPGLVQLERPSFTIKESFGILNIPVIRVNGSDGQIKVVYQAVSRTAQEGSDFTPLSGTLVFEDGESKKFIQVQIVNDRTKEPTESFEVRLMDASPGPGVLNFGGMGFIKNAEITILDDDMNHGFLELENPSYLFSEGAGTANIGVIRVDGTDGTIHVRYKTVPKTAIPGTDYMDTEGELIFENGVRRRDITVHILNDRRKEATKTFEVQLLDPTIEGEDVTLRALGSRSISLVSIWDDDQLRGTLKLDKADVAVPEDVGATILTIMRTGGSEGPLHGRFFTIDGTAHGGSDFETINGSIFFENGEMSQTISVPIKDDALREDMENFMVELLVENDPSMRSVAFVNIIDNDIDPGVFQFRGSRVSVREEAARVSLTIIRTNGFDGSVSLKLRAQDGTAQLGKDYTLRNTDISFSDGEREKIVDIDIINDNEREGTEKFQIGLFDPTNGANLGENTIFEVTILGDEGFSEIPSIPASEETRIFFTDSFVTATRGSPEVMYKIGRQGGKWIPMTVQMETLDGTALAGVDYKATMGPVEFKSDHIEVTTKINLLWNRNRGGIRYFKIRISRPSTGVVVKGRDMLTVYLDGSVSESQKTFHQQFETSVSSSFRGTGSINPTDLSTGVSSGSIQLPPIKFLPPLPGQGLPSSNLPALGSLPPVGMPSIPSPGLSLPQLPNLPSPGLSLPQLPNLPSPGLPLPQLPNLPSSGSFGQSSLPALPPLPQGQGFRPPRGQQGGGGSGSGGGFIGVSGGSGSGGGFTGVSGGSGSGGGFNGVGGGSGNGGGFNGVSGGSGSFGQSSLPALPPPPQGQGRRPPRGQQDCAAGLIFNPCFFGCPQVCNLVADPACNKGCTPTCVCPNGQILESLHSSRCILRSQCSRGGGSGGGRLGGSGGSGSGKGPISGGAGGGLLGGVLGGLLGGGGAKGGLLG